MVVDLAQVHRHEPRGTIRSGLARQQAPGQGIKVTERIKAQHSNPPPMSPPRPATLAGSSITVQSQTSTLTQRVLALNGSDLRTCEWLRALITDEYPREPTAAARVRQHHGRTFPRREP